MLTTIIILAIFLALFAGSAAVRTGPQREVRKLRKELADRDTRDRRRR